MSRPRGNTTSKAVRAARQAKAVEMINSGVSQKDIVSELGISRQTFWRDLQAIEARFVEGSAEDIQEFKRAQYQALMQIESALAEGTIPADVGNSLVRVRSEVAKLLGLNAPERKITAKINAESSPLYLQFKKHCFGLTEDQMEQVYKFAASLPRETKATVMDASWFPQPQLGDGNDAA